VLIGSAAVVLWAFMSAVLMRLWYWQIDTKFPILKELADLKLRIAQEMETTEGNQGADSNAPAE